MRYTWYLSNRGLKSSMNSGLRRNLLASACRLLTEQNWLNSWCTLSKMKNLSLLRGLPLYVSSTSLDRALLETNWMKASIVCRPWYFHLAPMSLHMYLSIGYSSM